MKTLLSLLAFVLLFFTAIFSLEASDQKDISLNDITVSDVLVDSIKHGTNTLTSQLIALGVDVNQPDNRGQTALAQAVESGRLQIAKLLLDHGANPNLRSDTSNAPPLCIALDDGNIAMSKLLMKRGVSINHVFATGKGYAIPTYLCAFNRLHHNDQNIVLYTLLNQAGFKLTDKKFPSGRGSETLLHTFARNGNLYGLQKWSEKGFSFAGVNANGESVLYDTMALDDDMSLKVVRFLVQHGADLNAINQDGETPLTYAKSRGNAKTAVYLLQHGG